MSSASMAAQLYELLQGIKVGSLPHWIFMPRNGRSFTYTGAIAVPAAGSGDSDIISFQVPKGFNGVINRIGNQFVAAGFNDGSGAVIWRIRQDQVPERNYENIISSLGSVAAPSEIAPIFLTEGAIVELVFNNMTFPAAGQLVTGRFSGWFYPKQLDVSIEGDTF